MNPFMTLGTKPICWPVINKTTAEFLFPPTKDKLDRLDPFKHTKNQHIPMDADVRKLLEARWPKARRFCRPTKYDVEKMTDLGLRILSVFAVGPDYTFSNLARLLHTTSPDIIKCLRASEEIHDLPGSALRAIGAAAERPEDVPEAILGYVAGRKEVAV